MRLSGETRTIVCLFQIGRQGQSKEMILPESGWVKQWDYGITVVWMAVYLEQDGWLQGSCTSKSPPHHHDDSQLVGSSTVGSSPQQLLLLVQLWVGGYAGGGCFRSFLRLVNCVYFLGLINCLPPHCRKECFTSEETTAQQQTVKMYKAGGGNSLFV